MFEGVMAGGGHGHSHGHNHSHDQVGDHSHHHHHHHHHHNDMERGENNAAFAASKDSVQTKTSSKNSVKTKTSSKYVAEKSEEKDFMAYMRSVQANGWTAFLGDNLHKVADGIAIAAGEFSSQFLNIYQLN
jgi:hypothetical protein